jgi:hypothetical protein
MSAVPQSPPLIQCIPENIPAALRKAKRWAPWAAPWDAEKQKYGKVPHRADRPTSGLSNGSMAGWTTFEKALAAYQANPGLLAGVGYLMTGAHGVTGVDLDNCVKDGQIAPWATEIIAKLDSYTEISPSGTGLHVMLLGDLDADWSAKLGDGPHTSKSPGIDVYGGGARFLTITGARVPGSPPDLRRPAPAVLAGLAARYRKSKDAGMLHVLPLPSVHGIEVPDYDDLGLPPRVLNFLSDGPDEGADRSALLIATGVALAGAGLSPEESFALMVGNDQVMEVALSKRQYDDTKAREYLWTHHCRRGAAIVEADRRLTLDSFDVAEDRREPAPPAPADEDFSDLLGGAGDEGPRATGAVADDFEDMGEPAARAGGAGKAKKQRFAFQNVGAFMDRPPARWIIKGALPLAALGVLYGASGAGKTFFALDMVAAVARGSEWRGMRVQQGGVAYVVAEGASGFRDRVAAYCQANEITPGQLPIHVLADAPNMMLNPDVKDLGLALRACGPLSLIVMDTYARVMGGGNENEAQDVNKMVSNCALLHRLTGAMVLLIHHSGKDASKGARGSGALRAAADCEIEVVRTLNYRAATITKMKDGEDGKELGFRLQQVVIGTDADGESITSCVVEPRENVVRSSAQGKPLTAVQQLVLRTLKEADDLGTPGLHFMDLKQIAVDRIAPDPEKKRDNRHRDVGNAIETLTALGMLVRTEESVIVFAENS